MAKGGGGIEGRGGSIGARLDGGPRGAASVSGLARFDTSPTFAAAPFGQKPMGIPGGINGFSEYSNLADFRVKGPGIFGPKVEALTGPVSKDVLGSISFLKNSVPVYRRQTNPVAEAGMKQAPAVNNESVRKVGPEEINYLRIFGISRKLRQIPGVLSSQRIRGLGLVPEVQYVLVKERQVNPFEFPYPVIKTAPSPVPEPFTKTENYTDAKASSEIKAGSKAFARPKEAVKAEPKAEKEEETEMMTEEKIEDKQDEREEEELMRIRKKYVVDEKALKFVIEELKLAVIKANKLAMRLKIKLTGKLVSIFIPGQNENNESEAVKDRGPDGSIYERQDTIKSLGEFYSYDAAIKRVEEEALAKPPVKIRFFGIKVSSEDVARVYKFFLSKPKVYMEAIRRVVKKVKLVKKEKGMVPVAEAKEVSREPKIEDYPALAEAFPKAA